jgi:hypothetical protein
VRDLEDVSERVSHHRPSIAVRSFERFLEHLRTGIDSALERVISVVDVHVQEGGERFTLSRRRDHDDGVTDVDLRRPAWLNVASCGEYIPKEVDLRRNVVDDHPRCD